MPDQNLLQHSFLYSFFQGWVFLFLTPQRSLFQFKGSIFFSIKPESLLRLQVLKTLKISMESLKVKSGLKAMKFGFVLIFSVLGVSVRCMWAFVYPFIHPILLGEMAVYFLPFEEEQQYPAPTFP